MKNTIIIGLPDQVGRYDKSRMEKCGFRRFVFNIASDMNYRLALSLYLTGMVTELQPYDPRLLEDKKRLSDKCIIA